MTTIQIDERASKRLLDIWEGTQGGGSELVHIHGPAGTGVRHLLRDFQHGVSDQCLTWHARFLADEMGLDQLPKIANGLWKTIRHSEAICSMVEQHLEKALGATSDPAVQKRMRGLIMSLRRCVESDGEQTILPNEDPLISLIHLGELITLGFPTLILFEDLHLNNSMLAYAFLDALLGRVDSKARLVVVISSDSPTPKPANWLPLGLQYLVERWIATEVPLQPHSLESIQAYLRKAGKTHDAMELHWWSQGWLGRILEMREWLEQSEGKLPPISFSLPKGGGGKALRIASLIGYKFPLELLSILSGIEHRELLPLLESSSHLVSPGGHDPASGLAFYEFNCASFQLRLAEDTLQKKSQICRDYVAGLNRYVGTLSPQLMVGAAHALGQAGEAYSLQLQQARIWSQESDLVWLQLMEVNLRYNLEWPSHIMGACLLGAVRCLFGTGQPGAQTALERALEWSEKKNQPRMQIELLRISYYAHMKEGVVGEALELNQAAIEIAQKIEDEEANLQLRFDRAEIHLQKKDDQATRRELALIRGLDPAPESKVRIQLMEGRMHLNTDRTLDGGKAFEAARELALEYSFSRTASDAGLHAIEAYIDAGELPRAKIILDALETEVEGDATKRARWQGFAQQLIGQDPTQ
jgi:hypothetical protein